MTTTEQIATLTAELRDLTRPQQYPGRIERIRQVTDRLWQLWQEHYEDCLRRPESDEQYRREMDRRADAYDRLNLARGL